jgi:diguanylate cyclase (GGDEF)-like protein/PAS domain S-box-containing protein
MKNKPAIPLAATELRQRAEIKLSEHKKKSLPLPATEEETLRLVHDLQVHQIELEMQKEELIQSRGEVEAALRQYTDLYDFAPVGYFTLTYEGAIQQVNLSGANLLGTERSKLIQRRFGVFVASQSRMIFNEFLERVFISRSKEMCEVELLKDRNGPLWANIEAIYDPARVEHKVCHAVMRDITERVQLVEELRHMSTHDILTGLYNRSFFEEEMARLERGRNFPISIMMADVDRLKETNDLHGHAAGDALLKRVAQVLTSAFRTEDVVARIGGDEFVVLLPATDEASAKVSQLRVRHIIQGNNAAHPQTPINISLGVGTAENTTPLSVVLKMADMNMYREKRRHNDP